MSKLLFYVWWLFLLNKETRQEVCNKRQTKEKCIQLEDELEGLCDWNNTQAGNLWKKPSEDYALFEPSRPTKGMIANLRSPLVCSKKNLTFVLQFNYYIDVESKINNSVELSVFLRHGYASCTQDLPQTEILWVTKNTTGFENWKTVNVSIKDTRHMFCISFRAMPTIDQKQLRVGLSNVKLISNGMLSLVFSEVEVSEGTPVYWAIIIIAICFLLAVVILLAFRRRKQQASINPVKIYRKKRKSPKDMHGGESVVAKNKTNKDSKNENGEIPDDKYDDIRQSVYYSTVNEPEEIPDVKYDDIRQSVYYSTVSEPEESQQHVSASLGVEETGDHRPQQFQQEDDYNTLALLSMETTSDCLPLTYDHMLPSEQKSAQTANINSMSKSAIRPINPETVNLHSPDIVRINVMKQDESGEYNTLDFEQFHDLEEISTDNVPHCLPSTYDHV